ncbi:hypothetical protein P4N68_02140 [Corynebacterium felinum]|uniref:Tautomerase enzyme n=1 Tax=Corynebacterium felinum TaxID=131318 RepID=A0ABU2BBH9_9CORY|nr:hypothetical protein [Corynebacterium felinum]MDF5819882.1 hypothetical protein [Corynebacterium felinum]MDR7355975.1 hypothetical protein [Corynebacterium felinum]WJY95311.1 hypothetical protein CFELI_08530 [Corynebacterium felinum]
MSVDPCVIIRKLSGVRKDALTLARHIVRQVADASGLDPFCIYVVDVPDYDRRAYGEFYVSGSKSSEVREIKLLSLIFDSIIRDTDWDVELFWGGLEDYEDGLEHMRRVEGAESAEVFDPYEEQFENLAQY